MPVTSVEKDLDALTLKVVFDAAVSQQRLWDAYADPRQLERFWGPPTYPAHFTQHEFVAGGSSVYVMVGPEGDEAHGWWDFVTIDAPDSFEIVDGFGLPDGTRNTELPTTRTRFEFSTVGDGSRLTCTTFFGSAAELEQLIEMGLQEGLREAMGQIDGVLAG